MYSGAIIFIAIFVLADAQGTEVHRNVIADINTDVELVCLVEKVKWILPVNMNDRSEVGGNGSEVVTHIIRNVTESDSNTIYTCEQPGIREHFQLIVIVPSIYLASTRTNFVRKGGNIELICTVTSAKPVEKVSWYHNDALIVSDQSPFESNDAIGETKFSLTVENVELSSSGYYTCSSSLTDKLEPKKVYIQILGEPKIVVHNNMDSKTKDQIIEWAIEGLELYGLTDRLAISITNNIYNTYKKYYDCSVGDPIAAAGWLHSSGTYLKFYFGSVRFYVHRS